MVAARKTRRTRARSQAEDEPYDDEGHQKAPRRRTKESTKRAPDYRLVMKQREGARSLKLGSAWAQKDGSIRIRPGPGVMIDWHDFDLVNGADPYYLTLWPITDELPSF